MLSFVAVTTLTPLYGGLQLCDFINVKKGGAIVECLNALFLLGPVLMVLLTSLFCTSHAPNCFPCRTLQCTFLFPHAPPILSMHLISPHAQALLRQDPGFPALQLAKPGDVATTIFERWVKHWLMGHAQAWVGEHNSYPQTCAR